MKTQKQLKLILFIILFLTYTKVDIGIASETPTVSGTLDTGVYYSSSTITSQGVTELVSGRTIYFLAQDGITIKNGFKVKIGCTFKGIIGDHTTLSENYPDLDLDLDDMVDSWEVQYGLDTSANDANADKDGDGLSNIGEYKLNSAPDDAVSVPRIKISYEYDEKAQIEDASTVVSSE